MHAAMKARVASSSSEFRAILILAFDTTSEQGGVAIHRGLECLARADNQDGANYSVTLFRMIDRLLSNLKLTMPDINMFAVATGPGSFTGIRVGVAAAQGWAQATGRPVYGASVLEAMVEQVRPPADWVVPILDARRREFVLSVFRRTVADDAGIGHAGKEVQARYTLWGQLHGREGGGSGTPDRHVTNEPGLLLARDSVGPFLERLVDGQCAHQTISCLVRERDVATQALRPLLPDHVRFDIARGSLMGAMARLALSAYREGRIQPPDKLDALYIRRSDAEMRWRES